MLPDWGLFLLLVVFGGVVGLDTTSLGQFMISRPIVAASFAGLLVGDAATGALLGLILEAMNLTVLPVGAARYPETGPAAFAAAAMLALGPVDPAAVLAAVLFALSWAWVAGTSVRYLRLVNMRLVTPAIQADDVAAAIERTHLLAIGADFLRGATLVALGMPLAAGMLWLTATAWAPGTTLPLIVLWSLAAAGITATLRLFGERRAGLFGLGFATGVVVLLLS